MDHSVLIADFEKTVAEGSYSHDFTAYGSMVRVSFSKKNATTITATVTVVKGKNCFIDIRLCNDSRPYMAAIVLTKQHDIQYTPY